MATQISVDLAKHFHARKSCNRGNTSVTVDNNDVFMSLHDNLIAKMIDNELFIRTCGYATQVTRDRLDSVLDYTSNLCSFFLKLENKQLVMLWRNRNSETHLLTEKWQSINDIYDDFLEKEKSEQ